VTFLNSLTGTGLDKWIRVTNFPVMCLKALALISASNCQHQLFARGQVATVSSSLV